MTVSETGPDPDQDPKLFELFRKAWNASGDDFSGQLERQSLRAAAPQFADRLQMEKEEAMLSEVGDTFPVPEGVCGQRPYDWRLTKALDSGSCVFLPEHEGKHSWEK